MTTPDSLDNLMKIHPPGTKFVGGGSENLDWFQCWYKLPHEICWHGVSRFGDGTLRSYSWHSESFSWTLYQEPKKKTKLWLWAYLGPHNDLHGNEYFCSEQFLSEDDAEYTYGKSNIIKLESTMIEATEDE